MQSHQITSDLEEGKRAGKEFIKWWRKENDFVDFELIDRFLSRNGSIEIENFELLDKEEMLKVLKNWNASGLDIKKSSHGETIEWQHKDKDGNQHTYTCPNNVHNLMSIFDAETQGDTIG
jgi:hypothetical protein